MAHSVGRHQLIMPHTVGILPSTPHSVGTPLPMMPHSVRVSAHGVGASAHSVGVSAHTVGTLRRIECGRALSERSTL